MSNVKPATDDEIVTIKSDPKFSITEEYPCTFAECLRLIARIESDRAEIARLKAEVERLTPKCPVCLGHRTTTPAGNIPCQSCGGTGRAR